MAYPKKILRLRPTKGVVLDVPAWEVGDDFLTGGSNVLFRDATLQRTKGERSVYETVQDDVLALMNARAGSTNYWWYAGTDECYVVNSNSSHSDVTPAGGLTAVDGAYQWSPTLLNGVVCASNGLDAPIYWDGDPGNAMADLTDWPSGSSCKKLVAFKYHLFALDMSESGGEFPMKVMWSDATAPGTIPSSWTASSSTEAGDTELSDTPGAILTAAPLRGSLLIYKTGSVYVCDYLPESNAIFSFRLLHSNLGALTRRSVADINGAHFVVSDGQIIITDGTNVKYIGTQRVDEYLFDQLDEDNYEMLFCVYHRPKNEVWVCYPTSGNSFCNEALIYDIAEDTWSTPRPLDDVSCGNSGLVNDSAPSGVWADASYTWAEAGFKWANQNFSNATEQLLLGQPSDPQITLVETTDNTTRDAVVRKHSMTFGDPERLKFGKKVHVRTKPNAGTLYVRMGSQMNPSDNITWDTERTLAEGDTVVNVRTQGKFLSVEVRSEDTQTWGITGIDIEAELRGYK